MTASALSAVSASQGYEGNVICVDNGGIVGSVGIVVIEGYDSVSSVDSVDRGSVSSGGNFHHPGLSALV